MDLEQAKREELRWRILRVLDAGRPEPVLETITLRALSDAQMSCTPSELRREMDYLENRKTIKINGRGQRQVWTAELTHLGVDIVEYTVACNAGIARPPKY